MYCAMSVHIKEFQVVEITGALHTGLPHNHIEVLAYNTLPVPTHACPPKIAFEEYDGSMIK